MTQGYSESSRGCNSGHIILAGDAGQKAVEVLAGVRILACFLVLENTFSSELNGMMSAGMKGF